MDEPTFQDVAYGDHERDVVDLYQADSKDPAPVYVYIHGGGFRNGDKAGFSQVLLKGCLEAGISVAAINYPLSGTAVSGSDGERRAIRLSVDGDERNRTFPGGGWRRICWGRDFDVDRVSGGRSRAGQRRSGGPTIHAADVRGVVAGAVFVRSAFYPDDYFGAGVCTRGATTIFRIFARGIRQARGPGDV